MVRPSLPPLTKQELYGISLLINLFFSSLFTLLFLFLFLWDTLIDRRLGSGLFNDDY